MVVLCWGEKKNHSSASCITPALAEVAYLRTVVTALMQDLCVVSSSWVSILSQEHPYLTLGASLYTPSSLSLSMITVAEAPKT